MKIRIKKTMWIIFALGFWGVLYPELTLTEDTLRIVWEDGKEQEEWERESAAKIYYDLLQAEPKQIKIKSRLLEILAGLLEKE